MTENSSQFATRRTRSAIDSTAVVLGDDYRQDS